MTSRRQTIGIDRRLDLEWLEAAGEMAASGVTDTEFRQRLWTLLEGQVGGSTVHSGRGKTVTVLRRIWSQVPVSARSLHRRALQLLPGVPPADRLAVHWAMVLGTYPFAADLADGIGRLLALQGDFNLAQLTRRLIATWGERSTLVRAAQRLVRSMIQWGVLRDADDPGVYLAAATRRPASGAVSELLIEAVLLAIEPRSLPVDQAIRHPAFFPFALQTRAYELRRAKQFEVHRSGAAVDVVALAKTSDSGLCRPRPTGTGNS